MHGPRDSNFNTAIHPPRVMSIEWDPPLLMTMGMASRVLTTAGARPGMLVSASREGTATQNVAGASTLLWSTQCSGIDDVTVVVLNVSPLVVDLPARILRLMVTRVEELWL